MRRSVRGLWREEPCKCSSLCWPLSWLPARRPRAGRSRGTRRRARAGPEEAVAGAGLCLAVQTRGTETVRTVPDAGRPAPWGPVARRPGRLHDPPGRGTRRPAKDRRSGDDPARLFRRPGQPQYRIAQQSPGPLHRAQQPRRRRGGAGVERLSRRGTDGRRGSFRRRRPGRSGDRAVSGRGGRRAFWSAAPATSAAGDRRRADPHGAAANRPSSSSRRYPRPLPSSR